MVFAVYDIRTHTLYTSIKPCFNGFWGANDAHTIICDVKRLAMHRTYVVRTYEFIYI